MRRGRASRTGWFSLIRAYALQDEGADTVEANQELGFAIDARDYQQCAEILFDLGVCKVRVISNNPDKLAALERAGLQIVERIPIEVESEEPAAYYLKTKKAKMGYLSISEILTLNPNYRIICEK